MFLIPLFAWEKHPQNRPILSQKRAKTGVFLRAWRGVKITYFAREKGLFLTRFNPKIGQKQMSFYITSGGEKGGQNRPKTAQIWHIFTPKYVAKWEIKIVYFELEK